MLCWECRKPNPDRAKYCASCGVKLEGAPEAVASPAQEEAGADAPGHDDCLACRKPVRWDWRVRIGRPVCPECHSGTLGRRVLAWAFDRIVVLPVLVVLGTLSLDVLERASDYNPAVGTIGVLTLLGGVVAAFLTRDAWFRGRSPGKVVAGLRAVRVGDGAVAGTKASVVRNLFFLIPGASLIAAARLLSGVWRHPGDDWAGTTVVPARAAAAIDAAGPRSRRARFCVACGRRSPAGALHCAHCGNQLPLVSV